MAECSPETVYDSVKKYTNFFIDMFQEIGQW